MRECGDQAFENSLTEGPGGAQRRTVSPEADIGERGASAAMRALWRSLLGGSLVVVEASTTKDRATLTLKRGNQALALVGSSDAQTSLFSAVVRGKLQKVAAIELGLCASTVASKLRGTIERMGLDCNVSRLPLSVALLAHAVERPQLVESYVELERSSNSSTTCMLVLKRCDRAIASRLSKTEFEIACQFLEGCSYEAIGRSRFTSVRTIANQVSSIFRKTGTSGRFALLRTLIEQTYPASPAAAQASPAAAQASPLVPATLPRAVFAATSHPVTKPASAMVPPAMLFTAATRDGAPLAAQATRAALAV